VEIISVFFLFAEIKKSLISFYKGRGSQLSAAASSSSELIYPAPSSYSSSSCGDLALLAYCFCPLWPLRGILHKLALIAHKAQTRRQGYFEQYNAKYLVFFVDVL
jgi:hypothetical protein